MARNFAESSGGAECVFCDIQQQPQSPSDVITQLADGYTFLVPALGMIVPGNYLHVAQQHVTSFAQLDAATLGETYQNRQAALGHLSKIFGDYVVVEHGSDGLKDTELGAGACIDHAHAQLIPDGDGRVRRRMHAQLGWTPLAKPEDLTAYAGRPYIYMGHDDLHYAIPEPHLTSQWARKQTAEALGLPAYDWALCDPYPHMHLLETMRRLSNAALELYDS
jgi:hypothetical protein